MVSAYKLCSMWHSFVGIPHPNPIILLLPHIGGGVEGITGADPGFSKRGPKKIFLSQFTIWIRDGN